MASRAFVPGMTGGREATDVFGQREQIGSHGRKARLRTGWSGLQRNGGAFGQGRNDVATAATELEAFGQLNRREMIERNDPSGIVSIDDRTAMPERRKARRDRKDIEAGTRLFGTAPVPVTGQRTLCDRWNAGFHVPCR